MDKQFITEIEDKTFTAVNAGAKLQKLSQITSGFVYHEDDGDKTFTEFHNAKNKELDSMLTGELAEEQVIVYCTYKGEIAIFKEMYKDGVFIHGGQSVTAQQEAIEKFKDGTARILFAYVLMLFTILCLILLMICINPKKEFIGLGNLKRAITHFFVLIKAWTLEFIKPL